MNNNKVKIMAEMAVAVALAVVLNFIPLWKMPQGGSVSLEMLPILIIALRWGVGSGMMAGLAYGLLQLTFNPYIIHPIQLIMDYPLPYLLLGLAGLFKNKIDLTEGRLSYSWLLVALALAGGARLFSHVLSGVVFFGEYAPEGQNVWLYSTVYNGSYIIPSLILDYLLLIPISIKLLGEENQ